MIDFLLEPRFTATFVGYFAGIAFLLILNGVYAIWHALHQARYRRKSTALVLSVVVINTLQALGLVGYVSASEQLLNQVSLLVLLDVLLTIIIAVIFVGVARLMEKERKAIKA